MYMFKFFYSTAHAVADRGLWDESADKMAVKWRSTLSPYTISFSELSDEEDSFTPLFTQYCRFSLSRHQNKNRKPFTE